MSIGKAYLVAFFCGAFCACKQEQQIQRPNHVTADDAQTPAPDGAELQPASEPKRARDEGARSGPCSEFKLSLTRPACIGECPSYVVSVDDQGWVSFTGRYAVAHKGAATERIAADVACLLARLAAETFERVALDQRNGDYCDSSFADDAGISIELSRRPVTTTLLFGPGCKGSKSIPLLIHLADRIDEALGVKKWTEGGQRR